ncbi:hypothetical protein EDD86DRAFT_6493 [Gorgonomyces haynaldii]|nr:hypothetical protein EDD86DRAFT_6493 [Gorgonomyces haynaldii]
MTAFVLVTGASHGLGKHIALQFGQLEQDFHMVICARDIVQLQETKMELDAQRGRHEIFVAAIDFSSPNLDSLAEYLLVRVTRHPTTHYSKAYLFNSCSTPGTIGFLSELTSNDIKRTIDVDLVAPMILTSKFLKYFQHCQQYIINITAPEAIQPRQGLGVYCACKAAREMLHRSVAYEESVDEGSTESLDRRRRVLSYCPGHLNSDMTQELLQRLPDNEFKAHLLFLRDNHLLVDPGESARVLVNLLQEDKYENASHVDFDKICVHFRNAIAGK